MKTEVAKLKLREAQSNLKMAEIILEMHENGVRELKEDIKELEAIINKKEDWRDKIYFSTSQQKKLLDAKIVLMQEMHAFAHARNEGWVANWGDEYAAKFGIAYNSCIGFRTKPDSDCNRFIFGISVKSMEIADEMFKEFGERIAEIYNKQY